MDKIKELTELAIKENLSLIANKESSSGTNIMELFRANYDVWQYTVSIIEKNNVNYYGYLSELLAKAGYDVNSSVISTYMGRVKKERNL